MKRHRCVSGGSTLQTCRSDAPAMLYGIQLPVCLWSLGNIPGSWAEGIRTGREPDSPAMLIWISNMACVKKSAWHAGMHCAAVSADIAYLGRGRCGCYLPISQLIKQVDRLPSVQTFLQCLHQPGRQLCNRSRVSGCIKPIRLRPCNQRRLHTMQAVFRARSRSQTWQKPCLADHV